ncbi:mechanosensitive ion channel family protein [Psychrobacter sp. FDAARGOS_221]|uniref:mechanosensitive ion channel family protein n=1 Tax=Psychrobacter sp. FDAARGOS_221 TaxID=1975705 RepID=UPI000BB594F4|nr:mechanosensitive ion channel family protein [Psychrobacter sp. FDAARGOS_221]PNK61396.1 mechanosensitive ion channel family protein [Psychrobacter sp. FDAARGOS_221]
MAKETGSQISAFFQQIVHDLYTSLYLAIGGSLEEETRDWASRGAELASVAIKIVILLAILGFLYWLFTYIIKHNQERLKLTEKRIGIVRSALRYIWVVSCIIAVMSQTSIDSGTVKATAKASIWAGIYFVLWTSSEHVISRILKHYGLNASIEQLLKNVFSVLIVVLGLASVMAQFGFDIVSLVAGLGIVGLAVGFAAQSTIANFISGITILLEQSFQVGDWIALDDREGRVILISLRTTHILTRDNITVIIPNSTVASSEVINITSKNFIRFDIRARIALEADIEAARQVILQVIDEMDNILKRPEPSATIDHISDFGCVFIVRFWVTPSAVARIPRIKEALHEGIKNQLQAADIPIPYPHMRILMPKDVDYPIDTKPFEITTRQQKD